MKIIHNYYFYSLLFWLLIGKRATQKGCDAFLITRNIIINFFYSVHSGGGIIAVNCVANYFYWMKLTFSGCRTQTAAPLAPGHPSPMAIESETKGRERETTWDDGGTWTWTGIMKVV